MTTYRLLEALRRQLDQYRSSGDPALVLDPRVLADGRLLADALVPYVEEHIEAAAAVGQLHWYRYLLLPEPDDRNDLEEALNLFAVVQEFRPDLVPRAVARFLGPRTAETPPGEDSETWNLLGHEFLQEYEEIHDPGSLDAAITALRRACSGAVDDHPHPTLFQRHLSAALLVRYEAAGKAADLDEAIVGLQSTVHDAETDPGLDTTEALTVLLIALVHRYEATGDPGSMATGVTTARRALDRISPDHPHRALLLSNLGVVLGAHYRHTGSTGYLEEAVDRAREAVHLTSSDQPHWPSMLSNLSDLLVLRYERTSGAQDLDEAVDSARAAAMAISPSHPDYGGHLSNLAVARHLRFNRTGSATDLDAALDAGRIAVQNTPTHHRSLADRLSNLSLMLLARHERTGALLDLDEAVHHGRVAVDVAPVDNPEYARLLMNLGVALLTHHQHSGESDALDDGIRCMERAAAETPVGHPDRAGRLSNLGLALRVRFERTGEQGDLDAAVQVGRQAAAETPVDHPDRAGRLSNLGLALRVRFERTGEQRDLDAAIEAHREAVCVVAVDHPDHARFLSNLGLALRVRFERTGALVDLDEAIAAGRGAVAATPADHPARASRLLNLGGGLLASHNMTGHPEVQHETIAALRDASLLVTAGTSVRAIAATYWGQTAAAADDWGQALDAFSVAIDLVNRMAPRELHRSDQEFWLARFAGLASDAAACALQAGDPARAVELWEQGRGVLLSQALDTRTDLTDLAKIAPELAGQFAALRDALDAPSETGAASRAFALLNHFGESAGETLEHGNVASLRRAELARDFTRLVHEIRQLPGFDGFLSAPRVDELRRAADAGPIVLINVSRFRSDALVLTTNGISVVALPHVTPEDARARQYAFEDVFGVVNNDEDVREGSYRAEERLSGILEWLWDVVMRPVLRSLGIVKRPAPGQAWPHVWWCPSGPLAFLPLHAAGRHDTLSSAEPQTVLDLVVSSYIPTVRALVHARERGAVANGQPAYPERMLAVAMTLTPNAADLPGAAVETARLQQRFPDVVHVLSDQAATRGAVLAALSSSSWVHLACHGTADPADPSSSHLLLADQPLTVQKIAQQRLDGAELAFLSACATARSGDVLPDEAIHLASAFQLAGYRHVIANLWPVEDKIAVKTAALFYPAIDGGGRPDSSRAALALHEATRVLRDVYPTRPSLWAANIHVGP